MSTNKISVVIFQDGNMWAAQCVEYDIGAQAESLEKLHECLSVVIEAERAESLVDMDRNLSAFRKHRKDFASFTRSELDRNC